MKQLKFLLMIFMAANIAMVTSCKKDEDDGTTTPTDETPTLTLSGGTDNVSADVTLETDEAYQVTISATENPTTKKNLERLVVKQAISGTPAITILDSALSSKTFGPFTIKTNAPSIETTVDWTITVVDKAGKTKSTTFTVTSEAPANVTPLATEKTGQFYHLDGTLKGAFDLVNNVEKGAGDPDTDKDMANTDIAPDPFTGSFQSKTATRFLLVTETYANIPTVEKATDLYNGGGIPVSSVSDPVVGQVYVVKLRNNEYAVLEIVSNDDADNTCSCINKGKLSFKYKMK